MRNNELVNLSKTFAVDIINLCNSIREQKKGNILVNQLLKSGTSIGANIHEANYASGRNDFINKLHISLKECYETEYWLELLHESGYIDDKAYESIYYDCKEIIKILAAIPRNQRGGGNK